MKMFSVPVFGSGPYRQFSGSIWGYPAIKGIVAFFFLLPLILSSCDMMGASINDFIEYNTGNARVVDFKVTSSDNTALIKTRQAWIHDPFKTATPGIISFEIKVDNPQNYDLLITPVIYEFIGDDGIKVVSPPNRPVMLIPIPGKADTFMIQIGDSALIDGVHPYEVTQGDSFRVRLDIATSDGKRNFEPYMGIPQIIYDQILRAPQKVTLVDFSDSDDVSRYPDFYAAFGSLYESVITWSIDPSDYHKGTNRISLTFTSKASLSDSRHWDFVKRADTVWEMENAMTSMDEEYCIYTDDDINFVFPFPFKSDSIADEDGWIEGFAYIITLKDKNGLTVSAGEGVSPETELDNLIISYHYRNTPESLYLDSGWRFQNKDKLENRLTVPFAVDKVRFDAVKGTSFSDGVQQVLWGSDHFDMPVNTFPLIIGEKPISMTVYWENPDVIILEDPKLLTYTFYINRLSPNRDSTLKNLIVQDASSGIVYHPAGGFQSDYDPGFDPDDANYEGLVIMDYTFYVPSTVSLIHLMGEYLSTSELYNDDGRVDGKANLGTPYLSAPVRLLADDNVYSDADYVTKPDLKIVRNGWEYALAEPREYFFRINVKPENDTNETLTRHYFITVVKTDPNANPNAGLTDITVKDQAMGTVLLSPSLDANTFKENLLNYTLYVPSYVNNVTIDAEALSTAEIRKVTSINLDTKVGDNISIVPTTKLIPPLVIPLPAGPATKRVTLSVYSKDGNVTSKDYTITLIKCRPSGISNVQLKGFDGSLEVTWTGNDSGWANAYEAWYSYYNDTDAAKNNPEKAQKALTSSFASGSSIGGLTNNTSYNVWVRAVNTEYDYFGDWKPAKTPGSIDLDYGIPGLPELSGFTITPFPESTNYRLYPISSSASQNVYTLTLPSLTSSVKVDANILLNSGVGFSGPSTVTVQSPNLPEGQETPASTVSFVALSPDKRTPKTYTFNVFLQLTAPVLDGQPMDKAVELEWVNPTSVPGVSYDVYYNKNNFSAVSAMESDAGTVKLNAISATGLGIGSLVNRQAYYFWVRRVKNGYPGEWSIASPSATGYELMPKSMVNTLNGISYTPGAVLFPDFDSEITNYSLVYASGSGTVSVTGDPKPGEYEVISYLVSDTNPSGENTVNPDPGGKMVVTINVAPDNPGASPKKYYVEVHEKPGRPAISSLVAQSSTSLKVNWGVTAGAAQYEIWCGTTNYADSNIVSSLITPIQVIHSSASPLTSTITGLAQDVQDPYPYYMWVRAVSADGIAGDFSIVASSTPDDGWPAITLYFPDVSNDGFYSLNAASGTGLSWAANTPLTVNVLGSGTSYMWYIDGSLVSGANTSSFNWAISARQFSVAKHSITAKITSSSGQVYSKTVDFEVTP